MITVARTCTKGFRPITFRNQNALQYYGQLQAVLKSLDKSGSYGNLFAKPEVGSMTNQPLEMEWTCSLSGKAIHYSTLSDSDKRRVDAYLRTAFNKIDTYISENKGKGGKVGDYADFLSLVARTPHVNQVWILGGKPTIVHWGFIDEKGLLGSSGIYPNWDTFISDLKDAKEAVILDLGEEPEKESKEETPSDLFVGTAPVAKVAKSLVKEEKEIVESFEEDKLTKNKRIKKPFMGDGLGRYQWVQWLAIILGVLIIIYLLIRTFGFTIRRTFTIDKEDLAKYIPPGSVIVEQPRGNSQGGAGGAGGASGAGGDSGGTGGLGKAGGDYRQDNGGLGAEGKDARLAGNCPICKKLFSNHNGEQFKTCILKAYEEESKAKNGKNTTEGESQAGKKVGE